MSTADRPSPSRMIRRILDAAVDGTLPSRAFSSVKSRATSSAWRAYLAVRGVHVLTFTIGGTVLAVDSRSPLAFPLWARRFERANIEYLLARTRPGDVFIDVGANIGLYSVPVARRAGPTGRVFAFEPCPPTAARLAGNIRRNALANVELVSAAASDSLGRATFHVFPEGMDVYNSLGAARRPEGVAVGTIEVDTVPLDEFCARRDLTDIALLKVDVEGAEELVLKGARRLLANSCRLCVVLELYAPSAEQCGCRIDGVVHILAEHGYLPHLATRAGGLIPVEAVRLLDEARHVGVDPIFIRPGL